MHYLTNPLMLRFGIRVCFDDGDPGGGNLGKDDTDNKSNDAGNPDGQVTTARSSNATNLADGTPDAGSYGGQTPAADTIFTSNPALPATTAGSANATNLSDGMPDAYARNLDTTTESPTIADDTTGFQGLPNYQPDRQISAEPQAESAPENTIYSTGSLGIDGLLQYAGLTQFEGVPMKRGYVSFATITSGLAVDTSNVAYGFQIATRSDEFVSTAFEGISSKVGFGALSFGVFAGIVQGYNGDREQGAVTIGESIANYAATEGTKQLVKGWTAAASEAAVTTEVATVAAEGVAVEAAAGAAVEGSVIVASEVVGEVALGAVVGSVAVPILVGLTASVLAGYAISWAWKSFSEYSVTPEEARAQADQSAEVAQIYAGSQPVILDLTGNGINITQLSQSNTYFDMSGTGQKSLTAWAGVGNGVLFYGDFKWIGLVNARRELMFALIMISR